jgi:hypothetical protein
MRRHRWTAWYCFGLDRPRAPINSSDDSRYRLATRVGRVLDLSAAFSKGGEGDEGVELLDRPVLPQSSNSTSHSIALLDILPHRPARRRLVTSAWLPH